MTHVRWDPNRPNKPPTSKQDKSWTIQNDASKIADKKMGDSKKAYTPPPPPTSTKADSSKIADKKMGDSKKPPTSPPTKSWTIQNDASKIADQKPPTSPPTKSWTIQHDASKIADKNMVDSKKASIPTEKKRLPVVKAKAPVAREVLVDKSTGAKYDMAKMRDAYEDLGREERDKKMQKPVESYISSTPSANENESTKFMPKNALDWKGRGKNLAANENESTTGAPPKSFMPSSSDDFWPTSFAKGGAVKSSASSRGDGCAQRGKTKGRFV